MGTGGRAGISRASRSSPATRAALVERRGSSRDAQGASPRRQPGGGGRADARRGKGPQVEGQAQGRRPWERRVSSERDFARGGGPTGQCLTELIRRLPCANGRSALRRFAHELLAVCAAGRSSASELPGQGVAISPSRFSFPEVLQAVAHTRRRTQRSAIVRRAKTWVNRFLL